MTGPAERKVKLTSLEAARFAAAFIVVLFHCNLTSAEGKYLGYEAIPFFRGGFSGVDFFFVLSGFVIFLTHGKDLAAQRGVGRFLWKRFQRLYPALWIVLAVLTAAMLARSSLQWAGGLSLTDIAAAFAIAPYPAEKILNVEWTLRYEVLFYALFALAIWSRRAGLIAWTALGALSVASFFIQPEGLAGFFTTPYPLLFVGGAGVCWLYRRRARTGTATLPAAGGALALGATMFAAYLTYCYLTPDKADATRMDAAAFGSASLLIVYGLVGLESAGRIAAPRWLQYLGGASYAIYLVHTPTMSILFKAAMKGRAAGVPDPLLLAFIVAGAVGAGVLFHELCEKPLLALTRRLGSEHSGGGRQHETA